MPQKWRKAAQKWGGRPRERRGVARGAGGGAIMVASADQSATHPP